MINREEAFSLLKKYLRDDKLIKHSLAVEAMYDVSKNELGKDRVKELDWNGYHCNGFDHGCSWW